MRSKVSLVRRVSAGRSLVVAGCLVLGAERSVLARSEVEVAYTREQTFSAALRYLRVDLAYEVTEKDADAAYLLFNFSDPELQKKNGHGSIELVQRDKSVRVFVNLPQLPSYREELLKRGLLDKLRMEYGEPPAAAPEPKQPKKPPAKPDAPPPADPAPPADEPRG
jgi:hypothetical protein